MKKINTFKAALNRFGGRFSEEKLIKVDYKVLLLLLISFLLFVSLVIFKIHGSSIGMWNSYIPGGNAKQGILLGQPQGIRSDEWAANTPLTLSQVKHDFSPGNQNVGAQNSPLLLGLPVSHFSSVFRPQNWGYFFLGTERGFSFFWNFKVFGLFLGFFLVLMLITKSDFWLSILGSFWLLFSGFIQWWFSASVTEMLASFCIIFVFGTYFLFSRKKLNIAISMLLLSIFLVNFALFLYPPFQIPLVFLAITLLAALFVTRFKIEDIKSEIRLKVVGLLIISGIILPALYRFYLDAKSTINLIMSTVYPGRRVSQGGEFSFRQYFSGFYGPFTNTKRVASVWGNVSEASSFVLLFPIVGLVSARNFFKRKEIDWMIVILGGYILAITAWMLFKFPLVLSKITLMSFVPSKRAVVGLGVANIILVIYHLSKKAKSEPKIFALVSGLAVFLASLLYGLFLLSAYPGIFRYRQVIIVSFALLALTYFLILRRKILFSISLIALVMGPNILVNPVAWGLSPIYEKPLAKGIKEIKQKDSSGEWIVFGNYLVANFAKAQGANVFNGATYVPDMEKFSVLDPGLKNSDIYNRSGHMAFYEQDKNKPDKVDFILQFGDDYAVKINPCSDRLTRLKINYFIFTAKPIEPNTKCLTKIKDDSASGFSLYRRKDITRQ